MTEIISFRCEDELKKVLYSIVHSKKTYMTVVIKNLIKIGLENTKESDEEINKAVERLKHTERFKEADEFIKLECRYAYAFKNFKISISKIKNDELLTPEEKNLLIKASQERLKMLFGEDSKQYKGALTWISNE